MVGAVNEFKISTKYLFTLVIVHTFEIHEIKCPETCPMSSFHEILLPGNYNDVDKYCFNTQLINAQAT